MLAEIFMLRLEATVRASKEFEHVSVRARHLAGDASDADLRSKYSLGLNGERTGRKKPFTRGSPLPSDHARLPQL